MEDGNASNNSDLSGYATANQSMEASGPATIPVGQLIDIPLQDTSNDVINFSQGFFFIVQKVLIYYLRKFIKRQDNNDQTV